MLIAANVIRKRYDEGCLIESLVWKMEELGVLEIRDLGQRIGTYNTLLWRWILTP